MNNKLNDLMKRKPFIYLLFLFAVVFIAQMIFNLANNRPLLHNFQTCIMVIGPFLVAYLASLVTTKKMLLFIICFILTFIPLLLQSFVDKSFVDYTSAILTAILALLYAGLSYAVALILIKRKIEVSSHDSKK